MQITASELNQHIAELLNEHSLFLLPLEVGASWCDSQNIKKVAQSIEAKYGFPSTDIERLFSFTIPKLGIVFVHGDLYANGITDIRQYAVMLHEIGHNVAKLGRCGHEIVEELAAWEWAIRETKVWTQECDAMLCISLESRLPALSTSAAAVENRELIVESLHMVAGRSALAAVSEVRL